MSEIRDELAELQGRVGELGRERGKFGSACYSDGGQPQSTCVPENLQRIEALPGKGGHA